MAVTNIQEIQIELDGNAPFEYVVAKQGEVSSREVKVVLLQNKQVYTIPSDATAQIKYYKPDGNVVLNGAAISSDRKYITVTYTKQMLAAAGTGMGEIVLTSGSSILRSATYYTKIVPTVYKENGLISDSEFLSLAETLIALNQATDKALNAAAVANTATTNANTARNNANAAATAANNAASAATAAVQEANNTIMEMESTIADAEVAIRNADNATEETLQAKGLTETATTKANEATATLKEQLTVVTNATQAANVAAGEAGNAAKAAAAAADACTGIAAGINSMTDTVDGKTYSLGIHGGQVQATEV